MKILWISPTPSHPQNAGNRAHIFAMAKKILETGQHTITFLLYGQEQVNEEDKVNMRKFWSQFFFVPHKLRDRKKTKEPLWGIDDWFNIDIESAIRFLQAQNEYDVVYCEYVFFSKVLTLFEKNTFKILSNTDRMSNRSEMLEKHGIPPDFFYTSPDQEKIALDRADLILAIQEDEKNFFQSLTQKTVIEVGYPIEINLLTPYQFNKKLRVGYIGSNNSLNRHSITSLLSVLQNHSELNQAIEIILAGTICNIINDQDGVKKLGIIDDEATLYNQIDLAINPMIDGTGLKIKTLSAIRHGMPFIATEAGSKGLPVTLPAHSCTSIEDIVYHLSILITDPISQLNILRNETLKILNLYQQRHQAQIKSLLLAISIKRTYHLRRKTVLLVTDIPFWEPGVGSHSRILMLCLTLQEHFALTIFFFGSMWQKRQQDVNAVGLNGRIISYKDFEEKAKQTKINITIPDYPGIKRWRHSIFTSSLKLFLDTKPKFDAIIFEYLWLAYTRDALSYSCFTILDLHDLMALREYRFIAQGLTHHVSLSLHEELTLLERFDAVLAIQNAEAAILSTMLKHAIPLCCPHGINVSPPQSIQSSTELRLGFVGTDSASNILALQWFLNQVWPVVSSLPITLQVFGKVCEKITHSSLSNVHLHGLIANLNDIYAMFDVMVNPMIHGGGIKIKSIEALAYGKPLIASPEGAVGIAQPEQSGVIVAKTRAEFINAIIKLVNDRNQLKLMAENAHLAAEAQFSPPVAFAPLIEFIRSV